MKVLGVDPGLKGALATWDGHRLEVEDIQTVKARSRGNDVNLPALIEIINRLAPFQVVYFEKNSIRPKEGLSSARKNGLVTGITLGIIACKCISIVQITPQSWKKKLGLNSDKEYSRTRAIEIFPKYHQLFARKKDHGRAEAALLAYYGYLQGHRNVRRRLSDIGLIKDKRKRRKNA